MVSSAVKGDVTVSKHVEESLCDWQDNQAHRMCVGTDHCVTCAIVGLWACGHTFLEVLVKTPVILVFRQALCEDS
jgi:hypothetical protein